DDLERRLGTDPGNADSDGDGLTDGFEVWHHLNPLTPGEGNADPDGDGLDNLGEQAARTDPLNPDTDADGRPDGAEVLTWHSDPRSADTDQDGLLDASEVTVHGTDPTRFDTDGGGVSDGHEIVRDGTDPLNPADDRPTGPVITIDPYYQQAVIFDSETGHARASFGSMDSPPSRILSNDGPT